MHYKDGQEAKLGDRCSFPLMIYTGAKPEVSETQGVIVSQTPLSDTCNITVAYPVFNNAVLPYVSLTSYTCTAKECSLVRRA